MKRVALIITALLLVTTTAAFAESGIRGRIAWRGELVPGITVRAYRQIADIAAGKHVAVAAPSKVDGTYSLDLPPGSYFLTARDYEGQPQPGNYFCYYSGSPIRVSADHRTTVGFNLIKIPTEAPPVEASSSGISGELSFQGEPLERAYLYVYKDPSKGFKGPGYFVQPVAKGDFRLRLPPGEYYLLARKRAKGGQFGPIEIGDYFNYYYGNPVTVEKNRVAEVKIETITRMPMLEEGEAAPFRGIKGVVTGHDGKPVAGLHVFAYLEAEMTGTPDFFSPPTGLDGRFELKLPGNGPYYLLARESFGGPAGDGELYGKFDGNSDHAVKLDDKKNVLEIEIDVEAQSAK
ncbi:MAG: hypothetical protein C0615_04630 [Desulfuromonas sp.]|nr:MAG: hypothetical protein C0615_04630 [Desulfuromonas sp.]